MNITPLHCCKYCYHHERCKNISTFTPAKSINNKIYAHYAKRKIQLVTIKNNVSEDPVVHKFGVEKFETVNKDNIYNFIEDRSQQEYVGHDDSQRSLRMRHL